MVPACAPEADHVGDPCTPETLTPELRRILKTFARGENFDGWDVVKDYAIGDNVLKLLSRDRDNSTLKEFMVYGDIDVCKEKLIELVMHMSHRKDWDDTYIEHEVLCSEDNGTDIIFSASKYPFPLAKRTYVIKRMVFGSVDDIVVIMSKVIPYDIPKRYKWSTQVDDFESVLMIRNRKDSADSCEMLVTYFENPKVILPNTYLNIIIETLVPRILERMVIACKTFGSERSAEFCKSMVCIPLCDSPLGSPREDAKTVSIEHANAQAV